MPQTPTTSDALVDEWAVAERLNVPAATVRQWRYLRKGPRFLKVGRHVRYDPRDVESWLDGGADAPDNSSPASRSSTHTTKTKTRT
jgi:hypothetical protein